MEVELTPLIVAVVADSSTDLADRDLLDRALRPLSPSVAPSSSSTIPGDAAARRGGALGIPFGTAKSRLHYALAAMRPTVTAEPTRPSRAGPGRAGRMTTVDSFRTRSSPDILEDLYRGRTPDYRDDVLATPLARDSGPPGPSQEGGSPWLISQADRRSCRVSRSDRSPSRSSSSRCSSPRPSSIIGSRPTKVPPPSGSARNGQVVYAAGGDIFTADPVTGSEQGDRDRPGDGRQSAFLRDGTHVAFMRQVGDVATSGFDLVVADANGQGPRC